MDNVEEIKSVDELRKAQAAAQAQGTSITNYSQWEQILEDLDTVGIQSTGSFTGDVKLHEDLMKQVEEAALQIQEMQQQEQSQNHNEESFKTRYETYLEKTKPLIDFYEKKGNLYYIDSQTTDTMLKEIEDLL